jgi:hypothetical protein
MSLRIEKFRLLVYKKSYLFLTIRNRIIISFKNIELVDVYGFGLVLYEMIYGEQMMLSGTKTDFNDCPMREFKPLLDLLLCDDAISKNGLPTINQLLEMPIFKNINIDSLPYSSVNAAASINSNSKLFSSSKVKELLIKAREHTEKRMNEEQKMVSFIL